MAVIHIGINDFVNNKKILNTDHMLENVKKFRRKFKMYDIRKVLISGLLTTNCLERDVIEEADIDYKDNP